GVDGDAAGGRADRRPDRDAAADPVAGAGASGAERGAALLPDLASRAEDGRAVSRGQLVGDGGDPVAGRRVPGSGCGRARAADPRLDRAPRAPRRNRPCRRRTAAPGAPRGEPGGAVAGHRSPDHRAGWSAPPPPLRRALRWARGAVSGGALLGLDRAFGLALAAAARLAAARTGTAPGAGRS